MTQGGYQVIIILPIKSKIAASETVLFCILCIEFSLHLPSFKVRGLQMTINLALV